MSDYTLQPGDLVEILTDPLKGRVTTILRWDQSVSSKNKPFLVLIHPDNYKTHGEVIIKSPKTVKLLVKAEDNKKEVRDILDI